MARELDGLDIFRRRERARQSGDAALLECVAANIELLEANTAHREYMRERDKTLISDLIAAEIQLL